MSAVTHSVAAVAITVVLAANLSACGGSTEVVASVDGQPITKAAVDHWLPIEAILTYQLHPTKRAPKGVVPDPPSYGQCVAYLRSIAPKSVPASPNSGAQLKSQCAQRYAALREAVISFLITTRWVMGEAKELELSATDAEARQRLRRVEHVEFPKESEFARQLKLTGETIADQMLRARVKVLTEKFERRYDRQGTTRRQRMQAVANFVNALSRKWAARTSCRSGYVVPDCKQYRGPEAPEMRI